jgi:condensin-2 complex subunit D3
VLERLELVMGLIHLDWFPDSLKSLVQTVAEIPVMAVEIQGYETKRPKKKKKKSV